MAILSYQSSTHIQVTHKVQYQGDKVTLTDNNKNTINYQEEKSI